MEKISQLMDGELGQSGEPRRRSSGWSEDPTCAELGDLPSDRRRAARRSRAAARTSLARLRAAAGAGAHRHRAAHALVARVARYTLPLAAGVAGVTLVALAGLASGRRSRIGRAIHSRAAGQSAAPRAGRRSPIAAVNDYLIAHQEFSPSTAMQGVASYVRTVSTDESERRAMRLRVLSACCRRWCCSSCGSARRWPRRWSRPRRWRGCRRSPTPRASSNYTGTFVYQHGDQVETSRITHFADAQRRVREAGNAGRAQARDHPQQQRGPDLLRRHARGAGASDAHAAQDFSSAAAGAVVRR